MGFSLIDEGGDWDRRNRLKVYRGVYCMSIRDFKQAATLFLDTVATFTSYELMDYQTFVTYTVLSSIIAMERPKLREKVDCVVCFTVHSTTKVVEIMTLCILSIRTTQFYLSKAMNWHPRSINPKTV